MNIEYQSCVKLDYQFFADQWSDGILSTDDIMDLNTMTFTLKVDIIDIFDKNGNSLDPLKCCNDIPVYKSVDNIFERDCHYLTWNINNEDLNTIKLAKNGDIFESSTFEIIGLNQRLEWLMKVHCNDENDGDILLRLQLKEMPIKIKACLFCFNLNCVEIGRQYHDFGHFVDERILESRSKYNNHYDMSLNATFEELKNVSTLTIEIKLGIMNVCYH